MTRHKKSQNIDSTTESSSSISTETRYARKGYMLVDNDSSINASTGEYDATPDTIKSVAEYRIQTNSDHIDKIYDKIEKFDNKLDKLTERFISKDAFSLLKWILGGSATLIITAFFFIIPNIGSNENKNQITNNKQIEIISRVDTLRAGIAHGVSINKAASFVEELALEKNGSLVLYNPINQERCIVKIQDEFVCEDCIESILISSETKKRLSLSNKSINKVKVMKYIE